MAPRYSVRGGKGRASDFMIRAWLANGDIQGRIEHVQTAQEQQFRGILEMIVLIQDKLDELEFPQSALVLRSWQDEPSPNPQA